MSGSLKHRASSSSATTRTLPSPIDGQFATTPDLIGGQLLTWVDTKPTQEGVLPRRYPPRLMSAGSCECAPLEEVSAPDGYDIPPGGPLNSRPACLGLALATLRAYPQGVEAAYISRTAGLGSDIVALALESLRSEGLAFSTAETIPWYRESREVLLWREVPHRSLLHQSLPRYREPPLPPPERIPPEFWWLFWSDMDPADIRLPKDAWYVASRMLRPEGSWRYVPAETWALKCLPACALRMLLDSRGYRDTAVGARIELRVGRC